MEFLQGQALTRKMRELCTKSAAAKIAIAYWGSNSLDLLHINPRRKQLRVLCCLKGGKSDPDVIRSFRQRARQHDMLHAKVIWTINGAIVGSANASSNGLPEEEDSADGLIEAGVLIQEVSTLRNIELWFDSLYRRAKTISNADLEAARLDRSRRKWSTLPGKKRKRSLIEALQTGGKLEFAQQRIAFAMCREFVPKKEQAKIISFVRENAPSLEEILQLSRRNLQELEAYYDWKLPTNTYVIVCQLEENRVTQIYVDKTFDTQRTWKVKGVAERITFALPSDREFPYKLSNKDKRIIRTSINELWKRARGGNGGRLIDLLDAAPILLKAAGTNA